MWPRRKLRKEKTERKREEKLAKQIEKDTAEFLTKIKNMTDIHLQELHENLNKTISTSEDIHNVTAALTQNRVVLTEILSRKNNTKKI